MKCVLSSVLKYHNPFPSFRSEFQLLYHVRQFRLMIINFAASLQHNNNNILRDVPVYEFNSNIFFSPDNDLKRPLATVVLCTHTPKASNFGFIYPLGNKSNFLQYYTTFYKSLEKKGHVADNSST